MSIDCVEEIDRSLTDIAKLCPAPELTITPSLDADDGEALACCFDQ